MHLQQQNGDATVTITFASSHNISQYDIIKLDNFTAITDSDFDSDDFDDNVFMVATVSKFDDTYN